MQRGDRRIGSSTQITQYTGQVLDLHAERLASVADLPTRCRRLFEREFSVEQAVRQIVMALSA